MRLNRIGPCARDDSGWAQDICREFVDGFVDNMGVCFLCDAKLFGERTRVCSSITPHSNVPYPEKIVELMGEEFVVIITPADHMCKKCTSLLVHMDKLENDLKLVKNAMLSYIQKKYGILPPDQPVKALDIVNGHLKTDELEVGQRKIPSGLTTVRENPPVHTPLKMIKPQDSPKLKIYKCGFCTFQSKELGHVRFHMRTHVNKKENEKASSPTVTSKTQAVPPPQIQTQKKRLYRCQVCSSSFDSRINCLDHIQKDHNQPSSLSTNEDKETEDVSTKQDETLKTTEENQQTETTINEDEGQQDNGTVDTNMLLNNNVSAASEEQESTNAEEEESTQETAAIPDVLPAQEEDPITESEKLNDTEITANGRETKTGDLDIESMLAAIHHDNSPTNSGNSQSLA